MLKVHGEANCVSLVRCSPSSPPSRSSSRAAIEQARAVEVPTEVIKEAETVLKEAMVLQDRIVP